MVVTWPARIDPDPAPRDAFLHVVDVVPTILEAADIPMPTSVNGVAQKPLEGASFLAAFTDPDFEGRPEQYFEVFSNRSIYADGWKANAQHTFPWRQDFAPGNWDADTWELYNLEEDFSESNDLAAENPEKLAELQGLFDAAATRYDVLPLDDRGAGRLAIAKPPVPGAEEGATRFAYAPGAIRIPEPAAPPMKNTSWTLTAEVTTEGAATEGVIMGFGGVAAGIVLYLDAGVPVFDYNLFEDHTVLRGTAPLPEGASTVTVEFDYLGEEGAAGAGADLRLLVNGGEVATGAMATTVPGRFGIDTFGIGEDSGQPISPDYTAPFRFTGTIDSVTVDIR